MTAEVEPAAPVNVAYPAEPRVSGPAPLAGEQAGLSPTLGAGEQEPAVPSGPEAPSAPVIAEAPAVPVTAEAAPMPAEAAPVAIEARRPHRGARTACRPRR